MRIIRQNPVRESRHSINYYRLREQQGNLNNVASLAHCCYICSGKRHVSPLKPKKMKNRLRYLITAMVSALLPTIMPAAPVDAAAASKAATQFATSDKSRLTCAHHAQFQLVHTATSASNAAVADYYVFNASDGNGFVIVAGDDRAAEVLAYGDRAIDMTALPDNVQWLLDQYARQMEYLFAHPDCQPSRRIAGEATVVPLLLSTTWGQRAPYRDRCPQVDGKPCVTGCVATSMAQVVNYWQFPAELPPVPAYTTSTLGLKVPALPSAPVQWDLMLDHYSEGGYTPEQGDAVALLMRYCGQACKMDYTIASSAAFSADQLKALKLFGYEPTATHLQRGYYADDEWHALLQEDLFAGRPVIYSGQSASDSHSFVIDGYDGSNYHVNWGWDGWCDGYFALDAMNGGGYKPSSGHAMLHGVCPAVESYDCDYKVGGIYYDQTGDNTLAVTCRDKSYNSYSGDVVIPEKVSFNGLSFTVTSIADNAFRDCEGLRSVHIPASVTKVGTRAFSHAGLDSITLPNSVKTLGSLAFEYCTHLVSARLGQQIRKINNGTFNYCTSLSRVVLPDSLKSIETMAFHRCALEQLYLPPHVVLIYEKAFGNCNKLTAVHISDIQAWCNIKFNMANANPLMLAHRLYVGGQQVTRLSLPPSVSTIGNYAFCGMDVEALTIPATMTSIGRNAFQGCSDITTITSQATVPPAVASAQTFDQACYSQATLYVPLGCAAAYRAADVWKQFLNIQEVDMAITGDVNADGEVSIADVEALVAAIITGDTTLDVNGDGETDIADANAIIDIILGLRSSSNHSRKTSH